MSIIRIGATAVHAWLVLTMAFVCPVLSAQNADPVQISRTEASFTRHGETYTIGSAAMGASYGSIAVCKGKGKYDEEMGKALNVSSGTPPTERPLKWDADKCVALGIQGDAGEFTATPDTRFIYVQDAAFMGEEAFYLIDVDALRIQKGLKGPAGSPSPAYGEASFDALSRTLTVVSRSTPRDSVVWIYDRTSTDQWTFRTRLSGFGAVMAAMPIDSTHILLWTTDSIIKRVNADTRRIEWETALSNCPSLPAGHCPRATVKADTSEDIRNLLLVSPNLKFAAIAAGKASWLVELDDGKINDARLASSQWDLACDGRSDKALPVPPPPTVLSCGTMAVSNAGSFTIKSEEGAASVLRPH